MQGQWLRQRQCIRLDRTLMYECSHHTYLRSVSLIGKFVSWVRPLCIWRTRCHDVIAAARLQLDV